jgi:lysozyme family protein
MPTLTASLRKEYEDLFNTCSINTDKSNAVEYIIQKVIPNKSRYETVSRQLGIPWYFIAVIHSMEAGLSFTKHLHNGDPLTARTVHVPKGRPVMGNPPFTWEESAVDALQYQKVDKWKDWSLPGVLYKIEEYNGWGYRVKHPHVLSPYLWSFSNHYTKGKYVADGTWSETAVSLQCGAAVLLRRMAEEEVIDLDFTPVKQVSEEPFLKYSNKKIEYGTELQAFLNKFPGIYLKEDGKPGDRTSAAVKKVFGFYLKGDSRG